MPFLNDPVMPLADGESGSGVQSSARRGYIPSAFRCALRGLSTALLEILEGWSLIVEAVRIDSG
jgi:hypothetical protein